MGFERHRTAASMKFENELDIQLRARTTLMVLFTMEEERGLQAVRQACERARRSCVSWDIAEGFQHVTTGTGSLPAAKDAKTALEQIEKIEGEILFVLKDFHEYWSNVELKRRLRSLSQRLRFTKKSILVTAPGGTIPAELRDEIIRIDLPPPDVSELAGVLSRFTDAPGVRVSLTKQGHEKVIQAALGLTTAQAQRVFAKALIATGVLDDRAIDVVTQEKKQIISESRALEFHAVNETLDEVGGLAALKQWLKLREKSFSQEARDYGLPWPKGIALVGIPGTGKSLTAKTIGALWRLPLLRFDVGALFGGLVGESEANTRRALQLAETIAPCILWIDEMEKALAQGNFDGGTTARVFGTILTWMAEKTAPCFVVATANNISRLPPELLRKGRFDEIFFLDLPGEIERQEIFRVHLKKRNRLERDYDVQRLAQESDGYVGAEIEQAIIDAMHVGFNDQQREFTTEDIRQALRCQVPLSVSQREVILGLRQWLKEGRAQSASSEAGNGISNGIKTG